MVNNKAVNLQYPINSSKDDFSIRFDKGSVGYISSNRPGGLGADDIYSFNLDKKIKLSLEGTVFNAKTQLPVSGAQLLLIQNEDKSNEVAIQADSQGKFRFNLSEDNDYKLIGEQLGFKEPVSVVFNTMGI